MNCFKVNDIYDYLEGILSPERREEIEGHLALCPGCRQAVEDRKLIAGAASSLAPLAVPDAFTDRVMARIAPVKVKNQAWLIVLASASSLLALTAMVMIASRSSALSILLSAGRSFWEYFKSAAVLTAKVSTLLTLAGKTLRPLLEAAYKGLSVLTSFIHPGLQVLILVLAIGLVVSLFFGMRKKFSLGD
jgi:predicted anti-sigma-YlaC factor YlaD